MRCLKYALYLNLVFLFTTHLYGWTPSSANLGIGVANSHLKRYQTDEAGSLNTIRLDPYLQLGTAWEFPFHINLTPEIKLGLPKSGRHQAIKSWNLDVQLPLAYLIGDYELRLGPGVAMRKIWGPGGTVELDNGFGTDSFFMPAQARLSANLTWMIGLDYTFYPNWSARFDLIAFNLFDSESRSFSQTLSIHYHLDLSFLKVK